MGRGANLAVVLVAVGAVGACGGGSAATQLPWEKSLDAALARARAENRLVMVDFYTDWCKWCKKLDATTLADPGVREALSGMILVRLDAEGDGRAAAERYAIDGYPTVVFVNSFGDEVGRIPGYMPAGPFREELADVLARS